MNIYYASSWTIWFLDLQRVCERVGVDAGDRLSDNAVKRKFLVKSMADISVSMLLRDEKCHSSNLRKLKKKKKKKINYSSNL